MKERNHLCQSDQLLDPKLHPVGTRLILAEKSDDTSVYEATIVEWAPSGELVKLSYTSGVISWEKCWNYSPVVIEVLQP